MATAHSHLSRLGFIDPIEPRLVEIPGAWFLMGSASGQDCERPVHRVWVDTPSCWPLPRLLTWNTTGLQSLRVVLFLHSGRTRISIIQSSPWLGVSWFDAERYCCWLAAQTGRPYRLPTEAEWERAARGDVEQKNFPWGDEPPQSLPDYPTRWLTGPEVVGCYAPNAFGLYNICDNVHEWCSDWYDANYYASSPERAPGGPEEGQRKASRGGSWRHHVKVARCSARSSIPPEFHYADYGFRVACGLQD